MKLTYRGTGTVLLEGVGEVSHGGTIEVNEQTGRALLEEQPDGWSLQTSGKPAGSPAARRRTGGGD